MKILLADDESLVRVGLKSMLQELNFPLHSIDEVKNGEEMVEYIASQLPDLVFVDIHMPKLNGLDAIAKVQCLSPHTKWIILTGFSEFSYAQEALKLGAINYLLKPVSLEELEIALQLVWQKHKDSALHDNRQFEYSLASLVLNTKPLSVEATNHLIAEPIGKLRMKAMLFHIDNLQWEMKQQFLEELKGLLLEKFVTRGLYIAAITLLCETPAIVWGWQPESEQSLVEKMDLLEEAIASYIKQQLKIDQQLTTYQTNNCENIVVLLQELKQLQDFSCLRVLLPAGSQCCYAELKRLSEQPHNLALSSHIEKLYRLYMSEDYLGFAKEVTVLQTSFGAVLFQDANKLNNINTFLANTLELHVTAASTSDDWFKLLVKHGDAKLIETPRRSNHVQTDLVKRVVSYVDEHYMQDIGIKQIAEDIYVTPNYLSSLFHKKQGITFVKYLTQIRMLKAKELLLSQPDLKIKQVSEMVGYFSTRHFTKLFQEYFDCYPSELREQQTSNQSAQDAGD